MLGDRNPADIASIFLQKLIYIECKMLEYQNKPKYLFILANMLRVNKQVTKKPNQDTRTNKETHLMTISQLRALLFLLLLATMSTAQALLRTYEVSGRFTTGDYAPSVAGSLSGTFNWDGTDFNPTDINIVTTFDDMASPYVEYTRVVEIFIELSGLGGHMVSLTIAPAEGAGSTLNIYFTPPLNKETAPVVITAEEKTTDNQRSLVNGTASLVGIAESVDRGTDTVGLYAPDTALFRLRNTNDGGVADRIVKFGVASKGWKPLSGDWNNDGIDTVGAYDPATGRFFLRDSNDTGVADTAFRYGPIGKAWIPLVGDWDDDGIDTIGFYDPATLVFYLRNSNDGGVADLTFKFGIAGQQWTPLVGDWNGNGTDTVGLYDPASSVFYLRYFNRGGWPDRAFKYGPAGWGWVPLAGDWDDDGVDTIGLYNPVKSTFHLRNTNSSGTDDMSFRYGAPEQGWVPLVGDWDDR